MRPTAPQLLDASATAAAFLNVSSFKARLAYIRFRAVSTPPLGISGFLLPAILLDACSRDIPAHEGKNMALFRV